jgi:dihydrofolate reductase
MDNSTPPPWSQPVCGTEHEAESRAQHRAGQGSWTMVVAASLNDVIGRGDALPWHLRSDLQRFKRLTMGHCLVMGRKTYESIGRPLPGRQTIVLSRKKGASLFSVAHNLDEVAGLVEPGRQVMVIGGAEIYRAALQYCDTIWLTRVLAEVEGDVLLPTIDWEQWRLEQVEAVAAGPNDQWSTEFQVWRRREPAP